MIRMSQANSEQVELISTELNGGVTGDKARGARAPERRGSGWQGGARGDGTGPAGWGRGVHRGRGKAGGRRLGG